MRKISLMLVLLLVLAVPLTACTPPTAGDDGPVVLRIGTKDEPDSTSPLIATLSAFDIIANRVFDDLITYDNDLNPTGALATDWSVDESGLVWTFNLREGVKWHDGEDFNADDVVWTYTTLIDGEYPQSVQLTGISKVEKEDDYTVKIYTDAPKADMESLRVNILPEHIYGDKSLDELHTFAQEFPVGTGPFKLVEWEQGQFLKFETYEDYYGGTPHIDEVVYVLFANDDTLMQALVAGEVDAITAVATNQVSILEQNPDIEVVRAQGRNFTQLGFNAWDSPDSLGNPLVLDWRIRNAISHAINKEQIVEIALGDLGVVATSLIPASVGDWHWEPGAEEHGYRPEKAMEILDDAGYIDRDGNGVREDEDGNELNFRFAVISSYGEAYVHAATIIQRNLQDIGIETEITTMDGGAQSDLIYEQNFDTDMFIWGWGAELDPGLKLSVLLTEQIGKRSDCYWSNEEYDRLFDIQVTQVDREERLETVHEMQRIAYNEAPYIILYNKDTVEAYRTDKFEGWTKVPSEIGSTISQLNKSTFLNLKLK